MVTANINNHVSNIQARTTKLQQSEQKHIQIEQQLETFYKTTVLQNLEKQYEQAKALRE